MLLQLHARTTSTVWFNHKQVAGAAILLEGFQISDVEKYAAKMAVASKIEIWNIYIYGKDYCTPGVPYTPLCIFMFQVRFL
ncbi:hypothetical protein LINGRAHAP2_LOCUS14851 [Linum grandiflorum]